MKNNDEILETLRGTYWLIAEDDITNQELISQLLQRNGIGVIVAKHGQDALEKLETVAVDGILMDCRMPVMDGLQTARQLRQQPRWSKTPILAFTGNDSVDDRRQIIDAGMDDVIIKPLNPNKMFELMAHFLIRKGSAVSVAAFETSDVSESQSPTDPDFAATPVFDPDVILELVGGREASAVKFLGRFLQLANADVNLLATCLEKAEWHAAQDIAHRLKTSSASIGAMQLSDHARNLEARLKAGSLSDEVANEAKRFILSSFIEVEKAIQVTTITRNEAHS